VQHPKGVKGRATLDTEATRRDAQQRQDRQAMLNNFTGHVAASR